MFVDLPKPRVNLSPFFRKDIMDHLDPDMTRQDKLRCALLLMGLTNDSEERRWCNLKLGESLLNATNRVNAYALEITKAAINAKIPGIREATYLDKFDLLKDFRFSSKDKTIDNLERFDFRVQVDYKPLSVQEPPIPQNEVEEYYFQLWKHYDATNQGEEVGLVFNEKLDDPSQFNESISKAQYETLESEEDKKQFRKHLGSKQEKAVKAAADQPAPIASQASASTASASTTSAPQEQSNPMGVIHPTAHLIEPVSSTVGQIPGATMSSTLGQVLAQQTAIPATSEVSEITVDTSAGDVISDESTITENHEGSPPQQPSVPTT